MIRAFLILIACLLALAGPAQAQAQAQADQRRFSEHENLNQAILAARATLDLFWQVTSFQPCGCSGAMLAVRLPWEGRIVDVDIIQVERLGAGQVQGEVRHADALEVPDLTGMLVTFSEDDIVDWGFGRDGTWHGLFLWQAIEAGANITPAAQMEARARQLFQTVRLPQ